MHVWEVLLQEPRQITTVHFADVDTSPSCVVVVEGMNLIDEWSANQVGCFVLQDAELVKYCRGCIHPEEEYVGL